MTYDWRFLSAFPRTRLLYERSCAWAWRDTSKSYHAIEKISSRVSLRKYSCVMYSVRIYACKHWCGPSHFGCRLRLPRHIANKKMEFIYSWNIWYGCGKETLRDSCTTKIYMLPNTELYRRGILARANYSWRFEIRCQLKFIHISNLHAIELTV